MTSGSTREFLALCAIAQHFGHPGTPTDQAWIESLYGTIKIENPHLLAVRDPAALRAELAVVRKHYNTVRLHAGIGYVTPRRRTRRPRRADPRGPRSRPRASSTPTPCPAPRGTRHYDHPGTRRCCLIRRGSLSRSQKHLRPSPAASPPRANTSA
ncbi:MAG: integrase core domain-containing protein [Nostocoides sp.]